MSDEVDPLAEFTGGDVEGAKSLRRALGALGELDLDPDLRGRIDAVLTGRLTMHGLADDPGLQGIADQGLRQLRDELAEMSPEQRAELVRRSTALAEESDPDRR